MGSDHLPPPDLEAATGPALADGRRRALPPERGDPRAPQEPGPPGRGLRADPGVAARTVAPGAGGSERVGRAGEAGHRRGPRRPGHRRRSSRLSTPWPACWSTCPSIEGFGLPPVEAMALGTPVVASPLPSTAGAAFEVDPLDTDSIAGGLLAVATDEGERHTGCERSGSERSAELPLVGASPAGTWPSGTRPRPRSDARVGRVAEPRLRLSLDVTAVPARAGRRRPVHPAAGRRPGRPGRRRPDPVRPAGRRRRWRVGGPGCRHWSAAAPGLAPPPLAWEQVRLPGLLARSGCGRAPRTALHDARAIVGADGGDHPRPELLRGAPVARAVQGPAVPAGHHGGRPSGGGRGLPEPGDRRRAGPVVPGGCRGLRGSPRGRHRPVPARRAGARSGSRPPGRRGPPAGRRAGRTSCSWAPSSPARTSRPWSGRSPGSPDRHPDALLVLAGGDGWGVAAVERGHRGVRGGLPDRAHRLRARRNGPCPAPLGVGGRLPGALRGVRAPGPRGPGLRGAPGHHLGDGHGGGGRGRRRPGPTRGRGRLWPTPSTPSSPVGPGGASSEDGRRRGSRHRVAPHLGSVSADRHLEAYRHAAGRCGPVEPARCWSRPASR